MGYFNFITDWFKDENKYKKAVKDFNGILTTRGLLRESIKAFVKDREAEGMSSKKIKRLVKNNRNKFAKLLKLQNNVLGHGNNIYKEVKGVRKIKGRLAKELKSGKNPLNSAPKKFGNDTNDAILRLTDQMSQFTEFLKMAKADAEKSDNILKKMEKDNKARAKANGAKANGTKANGA